VSWSLPRFGEKPLKMVWSVQKDHWVSYLVGTAHFFPYSFSRPLKRLLSKIDSFISEGPLDPASLDQIASNGSHEDGCAELGEMLHPEVVREINRLMGERLMDQDGSELFYLFHAVRPDYFETYTRNARPWMAMFSIWTTYLDWKYSVDLEAYQAARRMGKKILCLETLEEQIAVLNDIPLERVLRHFNEVGNWKTYRDNYVRYYLEGDLDTLVSMTDRFPTRTPIAIGKRDRIMFERLRPVISAESCAAFIGFPHVPGVRQLLQDDGFTVMQVVV
jgi:TraB/PrgY/gumN family